MVHLHGGTKPRLSLYFSVQPAFILEVSEKKYRVKLRRVAIDMEVIIFLCLMVPTITALIALFTKDRKANSHQAARTFFLRPPLMGTTNPRKSGYWYTTNWFAGEKVKEALLEGQERNAHQRRSRHTHSQQKRSRHNR